MEKVIEYVKKPVKIEAIKWNGRNEADIWAFTGQNLRISRPLHEVEREQDNIPDSAYCIFIPTLEGEMRCDRGDYVIKGIAGEFYPCKPDIFEKTYEPVNPE